MNRIEQLLVILMEEAAEFQQAASKALRFGLQEGRNVEAKEYGDNLQRLAHELSDFQATVELLRRENLNLPYRPDLISIKQEKIEKYLKYSIECGTLS